jgi:hypothetical protein
MTNAYTTEANGANTLRNSTFNYSNTSGLRRTNPFWFSVAHQQGITPAITEREFVGYLQLDTKYSTNTYASTSDGQNTLITSLSATSWDWQNHFEEVNSTSLNPYYRQIVFRYKIVVETFTPLRYKIYAQPISNFSASGTYITNPVYDSDFPLLFNSTYLY